MINHLKVLFVLLTQVLFCIWIFKAEKLRKEAKLLSILKVESDSIKEVCEEFDEIVRGILPSKKTKLTGLRKIITIFVYISAIFIELLILTSLLFTNIMYLFFAPFVIITLAIIITTVYKIYKCADDTTICDTFYIKYINTFLALIIGWGIAMIVELFTTSPYELYLASIVCVSDGLLFIPFLMGISFIYKTVLTNVRRLILMNYQEKMPKVVVYTENKEFSGNIKDFLDENYLVIESKKSIIFIPWKEIKQLEVIK